MMLRWLRRCQDARRLPHAGPGPVVESHEFAELGSSATETTIDRASLHAANDCSLCVRRPACANQNQDFALLCWKLGERNTHICEVEVTLLISGDRNPPGVFAVTILLDLAGALPVLRIKNVAENGEQPRAKICSRLKFLRIGPGAQQGLLNEVVSKGHGSAERNRERPQTRNLSAQVVLKALVGLRSRCP